MTTDHQKDPLKSPVLRFLPWLLGAAMLIIYGLTLNRWVTLLNINQVAAVSGWNWQPQLYSPLMFLVTAPFRWLPAAQIPVALNLFSAVCAAGVLAMLARSVAILPHDRTNAERQCERNDFAFLTGWMAWVPPVVAVALAGLQLTFWEHATSFTGETFDLLLFAFVIWQLLEFRLDEKEWRLFVVALVYGAGFAENWAMVAYFPIFLAALIWLRKLDFFNLRFLGRLVLCGLAGMLFYLVLPLVAKFSAVYQITFWQALRPNLALEWHVIQAITQGDVRHNLALMALTTLLPVLVISLRWSSTYGDKSRMGVTLANLLFHFVHAVIFGVCVWVMFDPAISPRQLGLGTASLTLYYFTALSIGYFCGYFLLVFGKKPVSLRRNSRPLPVLPRSLNWLCPVIVAGTGVAVALAVGILIYKNAPMIRGVNGNTLAQYARLVTGTLPAGGAILLCDNDGPAQNQKLRQYLCEAMLVREGRTKNYPVVDTAALNWAPYHRWLHQRFPNQWPKDVSDKEMGGINPIGLLGLLTQLSQSNNLCYLNPSFGYYFEQFYLEPHGLVYWMKLVPKDTLLPPPLATNLVAENEAFWTKAAQETFPRIESSVALQQSLDSSEPRIPKNFADWLLMHLHVVPEPNPNNLLAGFYYSRDLDYWGVQLQQAGDLAAAATHFADAEKLNPQNVAAGINLAFNQKLRTGATSVVDPASVTPDRFGQFRDWNEVLNACGPFDETSFCFKIGVGFMQNSLNDHPLPLVRQSLAEFTRVRQLAPDNLAARLWLAQLYLFSRKPDLAMEALHDPITQPARFSLNATNSAELNILAAAAHFQKNETAQAVALLQTEVARHPDDTALLTIATQAYMMHGLYTNALAVIDHKLAQTPDAPQWLFGKGYANLQLGHYTAAIAALTRVLDIQTNDPTALFNRALAYLKSDQLDPAHADYARLQSTYTNAPAIAYGLGEIAWRRHDTNEAVRNYSIYLSHAPTNSAEYKTISGRLAQLRGK